MGGMGENVYWIFNADTPFRLTHVHQILQSQEYPPNSISNLDVSHHYHYGGPAIASFLSELLNIDPNNTYFYVAMPLVFFVSCALLLTLVWNRTKSFKLSIISTSIAFLLYVKFSDMHTAVLALARELVSLIYSFDFHSVESLYFGASHYSAQKFGHSVFDIPYLLLFSLIPISLAIFNVKNSENRIFLWVLCLILFVFLKSDSVPIILLFLCSELVFIAARMNKKYFLFIQIVFVVVLLFLCLFGLEIKIISTDFVFQFKDLNFPIMGLSFFIQTGILLIFFIIALKIFDIKKDLIVTVLWLAILLFIFINTIEINFRIEGFEFFSNFNQVFMKAINTIFIIISIFFIVEYSNKKTFSFRETKLVMIPLVLFMIYVPFKVYHNLFQLGLLFIKPSLAHESYDFFAHKQCLEKIPVLDSVLLLNSFTYPTQNHKRDNRAMHVTAIYGHNAYASNSAYEKYPIVKQRINVQKEVFANEKATKKEICKVGNELKGKNKFLLIDKVQIWPEKLNQYISYQNQFCAVVNLSEEVC